MTSINDFMPFVDLCFDKFHSDKTKLREYKATFMFFSGISLKRTYKQP